MNIITFLGLSSTSNTEEISDQANIDNPNPQIPTVTTGDSECNKGVLVERQETTNSLHSNGNTAEIPPNSFSTACQSQTEHMKPTDSKTISQSNPCHNIGDHSKSDTTATGYLSNSPNSRKGGDTISNESLTSSFIMKCKPGPPRRTNTLGNIDIELINDEGETDCVDIDIADIENIKDEEKLCNEFI